MLHGSIPFPAGPLPQMPRPFNAQVAWGEQLDGVVRDAARYVLAAPWPSEVDCEMAGLQSEVALIEAEACCAALRWERAAADSAMPAAHAAHAPHGMGASCSTGCVMRAPLGAGPGCLRFTCPPAP